MCTMYILVAIKGFAKNKNALSQLMKFVKNIDMIVIKYQIPKMYI